ncbi:RNA polymerase sigma factor SigM [Actinomycetospora chlora]|uniref:RNA polymerase sigma factor SigM n=1 Tax=Actinomycetospora chlora TaxID=663608 RepID=A0ABP9BQE2_9PSEU
MSTDHEAPGDDRALLAAHVAGAPGAFAELVRRHQDRLWRTARAMLRDPDEAADAVQDALLRAFRLAHTFRGDAEVVTWLHTVVTRVVLDRVAARDRRRTEPIEDVPPGRVAVADPVRGWADEAVVRDVVASLPADQRECFVRIDMIGFAYDEVARELGVSVGTVKSRRARAKVAVAVALREAGFAGPNRLPAQSHPRDDSAGAAGPETDDEQGAPTRTPGRPR